MKNNKIYISTTLPYANSKPHVGHALELVQADFLSRFYRLTGKEVFFNTGLDEHGVKIFDKATELGISPKEHIDNQYKSWIEFCELFSVSYDKFYRTTDEIHRDKVFEVWNILKEKGLIEKKSYTAKYCKGCEEFKNEKELVLGKCETHTNLKIEEVDEENYFLKDNSSYSDSDFLYPDNKTNELLYFYNRTQDLSISRLKEKSPWGIETPGDDTQTIYVWLEALVNYINSCGEEYWNEAETIILCGPDNLRFQGKLLRQIYEASDYEYLNRLYVHSTILDANGKKMSKSLGNVIDPVEQINKFGRTAVRYYILAGLNTSGSSSWDEKELPKLYNAHIVNDYGNLIARTLHLIDTNNISEDISTVNINAKGVIDGYCDEYFNQVESYQIYKALDTANKIVKYGNVYVNDNEPWKLDDPSEVLNTLLYLLKCVTELYRPVLPDDYDKVTNALNNLKKEILFEKL